MAQWKRDNGLPLSVHTGRKPLAERYRRQVQAVEKVFADALPALAQEYLDELHPRQPEECRQHHVTLCCPVKGCEQQSERTAFDHKAAAYALDRILGRPTARLEQSIAIRLVEELTATFAGIFHEVNDYDSAAERRARFAERCRSLGAQSGGPGG
jgi:hypothetical protein